MTDCTLSQFGEKVKPISFDLLSDRPLVSVLIANYNYANYVGQAIESVLEQAYNNFEVIVCDDGSVDNSCQVIERYALRDSRIKLVCKPNGGVASALNAAFTASSGELLAILDADDVWFSKRLELVVQEFLKHPDVGMVTHPLKVVHTTGKVFKDIHPRKLSEGWLVPKLLQGNGGAVLSPASGLTLRREAAQVIFPLPEVFRTLADVVVRERAALLAPVAAVHQVMGLFRQHGNNLTGVAGPVSLQQIDASILRSRQILEDRVQFVKAMHGLDCDPVEWEIKETKELLLAKSLLKGERVSQKDIFSHSDLGTVRRLIWVMLFASPKPVAQRLYRWWWGEGFLKRWLRKQVFLSRW